MAKPKRKVTLSLDGDALEALQAIDTAASLSSLVDAAIADRLALARQRQAVDRLVSQFEAAHGALDEDEIAAAMQRLQAS